MLLAPLAGALGLLVLLDSSLLLGLEAQSEATSEDTTASVLVIFIPVWSDPRPYWGPSSPISSLRAPLSRALRNVGGGALVILCKLDAAVVVVVIIEFLLTLGECK
jgi:hypothetical protein